MSCAPCTSLSHLHCPFRCLPRALPCGNPVLNRSLWMSWIQRRRRSSREWSHLLLIKLSPLHQWDSIICMDIYICIVHASLLLYICVYLVQYMIVQCSLPNSNLWGPHSSVWLFCLLLLTPYNIIIAFRDPLSFTMLIDSLLSCRSSGKMPLKISSNQQSNSKRILD